MDNATPDRTPPIGKPLSSYTMPPMVTSESQQYASIVFAISCTETATTERLCDTQTASSN
eukprot:9214562-Pyramimonas_sp.AAC.1